MTEGAGARACGAGEPRCSVRRTPSYRVWSPPADRISAPDTLPARVPGGARRGRPQPGAAPGSPCACGGEGCWWRRTGSSELVTLAQERGRNPPYMPGHRAARGRKTTSQLDGQVCHGPTAVCTTAFHTLGSSPGPAKHCASQRLRLAYPGYHAAQGLLDLRISHHGTGSLVPRHSPTARASPPIAGGSTGGTAGTARATSTAASAGRCRRRHSRGRG